MSRSKLSKWLRSGVIKQNIKSTLKSTIDSLRDVCPLKVSSEIISKSLHDILCNDKVFREQSKIHTKIFDWFKKKNEEKNSPKPSRPYAVFKKRVYSSAFFGSKVTNNYNTEQTRESSPPPVKQIFSFSDEEQGAIIEPLLNLVEKALNEFLIKNEHMISSEVVEGFAAKQRPPINPDFSNADTLNMLNFMIENIKIFDKSVFHGQHKSAPVNLFKNFKNNVRHKMAHGILIDQKVDGAITHSKMLLFLRGNYKELYAIKERLDNAIIEKWTDKPTLEVENKNYENQIQSPKRKHDDSNFCEMEDEDLIQIWRAVKTTECRRKQSHEFIDFVNLAFNLDLKCIGTEVEQSKFYSDSPEAKQVMYMVTIVGSANDYIVCSRDKSFAGVAREYKIYS
ncbi:13216_t:CDS:2 [Dentiscutata heterogama]|uniref:13216_t:CDS:1 n=1 Tax=Dentiscutata heterogama TaxID=1316150 RepID=A0ACA9KT70_9GLOM|nr:13216_t:CDS:2 [Dentiscutata heterogama]